MSTVTDPTNEWYSTRQQSPVTARPRRGVVLHHGATTSMDAILDMEINGTRQVSSNRVVKDKRCARVVSDDPSIRAWSLSDAFWDSVLASCECANESTNGWTISPESQETIAQWVAFRAQNEGWIPHRNGDPKTWTVYGHREIYTIWDASYATACPGGMDLDWIAARAFQILQGSAPKKQQEDDMGYKYFQRDTGPNGKTQWMLTGVQFPGGVLVTQDLAVANGWAPISDNGGAVLTDDRWQPVLDTAKRASDDYWARMAKLPAGGGGTPLDPTGIIKAIETLGVTLGTKIDALPAEIDRYNDGTKQSK